MLRLNSELKTNNKTIGMGDPTYFIASIAASHGRNLKWAMNLAYPAVRAGTDAAKFQQVATDTVSGPRWRSRSALLSCAMGSSVAMPLSLPVALSNPRISVANS